MYDQVKRIPPGAVRAVATACALTTAALVMSATALRVDVAAQVSRAPAPIVFDEPFDEPDVPGCDLDPLNPDCVPLPEDPIPAEPVPDAQQPHYPKYPKLPKYPKVPKLPHVPHVPKVPKHTSSDAS